MATSRSSDEPGPWIGGASVFSGRPDPIWSVDRDVARRLEEIWDSLEPWSGEQSTPPILGYRGCFLRAPEGHAWLAHGELVTLEAAGGPDSRRDRARAFELLLLSSAPEGMLPPTLKIA